MTVDVDRLWRKMKPDDNGLVPCVVVDVRSNTVLMVAWVNEQALGHSIDSGWATYWSRSRATLWEKGATSGNRQRLVEIRLDCDADTLQYVVEAEGPACHMGFDTCFFLRRMGEGWSQEPQEILNKAPQRKAIFDELENLIAKDEAASAADPGSNNRVLFKGGVPTQSKALKEQTDQLAKSLGTGKREHVREDAADLIYLLSVALRTRKIALDDVFQTLLDSDFGDSA